MTDKQIKFYNKFTPKEQHEKFGIISVHFEPFDLDNLTSWTSKEYAEFLYQQKLLKKEVKCED